MVNLGLPDYSEPLVVDGQISRAWYRFFALLSTAVQGTNVKLLSDGSVQISGNVGTNGQTLTSQGPGKPAKWT